MQNFLWHRIQRVSWALTFSNLWSTGFHYKVVGAQVRLGAGRFVRVGRAGLPTRTISRRMSDILLALRLSVRATFCPKKWQKSEEAVHKYMQNVYRCFMASAWSEAYPRRKRNPSRLSEPNQVTSSWQASFTSLRKLLANKEISGCLGNQLEWRHIFENYTGVRFLQESIWQPWKGRFFMFGNK